VAHCHNLVPLISPSAYYACRDEGVPVVQTLHNFRLRCPAGTMFRDGAACEHCAGLGRAIAHGCYRDSHLQTAAVAMMLGTHRGMGTYKRAVDVYSAPSAFCARMVACGDIPREKITVRPNFLLQDPGARRASGNFALFVGRLCEEKGVRTLLRAWQRLPHVPLVMVGDGPLRQELQRSASNNITFTGELPAANTLARMKGARFLVFPSLGYETFGMAVLEAAACGVATIGARLGAVPELVYEGRTGLLFDPHDVDELVEKVQWAWTHPVSVNEMGVAARRQYLRHFTAERAYEGMTAWYGSVAPEWTEATENAVA
jgi:glycosyltransferase involved in cell wall biosynthesis